MTSRHVGERLTDLKHGELLVLERSGCDGCAYLFSRNDRSHSACNAPERFKLAGSCTPPERHDKTSVQFVKPNDYAVFKLTGEWP